MKLRGVWKGLLLGVAVLLAASAFAANKGSLQLMDSVQVGGTQLSPGDYQLKWEGSGSNVQLSFLKGSKVVATTAARVIDLSAKPYGDAAVVKSNADGTRSLSEIHFSGKMQGLVIGSESASADGNGGSK